MAKGVKGRVGLGTVLSEEFIVNTGLKQEDALSSLVLEHVIRQVQEQDIGLEQGEGKYRFRVRRRAEFGRDQLILNPELNGWGPLLE